MFFIIFILFYPVYNFIQNSFYTMSLAQLAVAAEYTDIFPWSVGNHL